MKSKSNEQCYLFHAYANMQTLPLSTIHSLFLEQRIIRRDKNALEVVYEKEKRLYIFEYGALVFFNVSLTEQTEILKVIAEDQSFLPAKREAENFSEDDYILRLGADRASIHFNEVRLPSWDSEFVYHVAEVLSKSAALDVIEQTTREHVQTSEEMTQRIKSLGGIRTRRSRVLQFIAEGLSVRHLIINKLSLLDTPEDTWEHQDLHTFHRGLVENFELKNRLASVEKELDLTAEVSSLLLETLNTKRSEFLEVIIIVLIAVEIVHTFSGAL